MSTTLPAPPEPELPEVLQDIAARFLPCLPPKELQGVRIFFQLRQMYWFYQDFLAQNKRLPKLKFAVFCQRCVEHVEALAELFRDQDFDKLLFSYSQYLQNVPSCGCILVNPDRTKVLLIRGFTFKRSWSFPKGKVNEKETELECAIREVREEVGLDLTPRLLSLPHGGGGGGAGGSGEPFPVIRSERYGKRMSLYVIPDVPEDTPFQTRTIGEVSDIRWFSIKKLPKNYAAEQQEPGSGGGSPEGHRFWAVGDFMPGLRLWLAGKLGAADKLAAAAVTAPKHAAPGPAANSNARGGGAGRPSAAAAPAPAGHGRAARQPRMMPAKRPQQQRLHAQYEQANHAALARDTALELAGVEEEYAVVLKPGSAFGGLSQVYSGLLPGAGRPHHQAPLSSPSSPLPPPQLGLGVDQLAQALGYVDLEEAAYIRLFAEASLANTPQQPPVPSRIHPAAHVPEQFLFAGFEEQSAAPGGPPRGGNGGRDPGQQVEEEQEDEDHFEFPEDGAYAAQKSRPADLSRHSQAAWDSRNQTTFGEGLAASSFSPQQMLSQHDRSLSRLVNVPSAGAGHSGGGSGNSAGSTGSKKRSPAHSAHPGKRQGGKPRDADTFGAAGVLPPQPPIVAEAPTGRRPRGPKSRSPPVVQQHNSAAGRSGKRDDETFGHMM